MKAFLKSDGKFTKPEKPKESSISKHKPWVEKQ